MTETASRTYTDQSAYVLALTVAADVIVTQIEYDPYSGEAATITRGDRRATVEPAEDGTCLEWQLLRYPGRGRWRLVDTGEGDEIATRTAVFQHLRTAELW